MNANKNTLYKDVKFLADTRPYRNYENLESLEKVAAYIKKEFSEAGFDPETQKWIASRNEYSNIIASYNPEAKKRLIVGAHYDVDGDQPGADDNASAIAGLLETARLVAASKPTINYRIDFVAYCLEEMPFAFTNKMGSYIHANSLHDNKVEVIGMICYEMIGYFSEEPGSQPYPSPELAAIYPDTANFIIVVGIQKFHNFNKKVHRLMSKDSKINVELISFPDDHELAGLSDQYSYWKFGYPALMINDTSFIRNPNYHEITDTIETLDFDKMAEVVNSAYNAITKIN
jgi:hypothetical protein